MPGCFEPRIRIVNKMYFRFWHIHVGRLYMVSIIGQVLCELLRSPNGFIQSVLNANLIFFESLANSGYIESKFFHCRASVGCRIIPSVFWPFWCHLINSVSVGFENSRSFTGKYHITIAEIFLPGTTDESTSATSLSVALLPVLYLLVPQVGHLKNKPTIHWTIML